MTAKKTAKTPKSKADRELVELVSGLVSRVGPSEAARRLGTTARSVERWAKGTRAPRPEARERIRGLAIAATTTTVTPLAAR
jgi:DNA-binding transcriptional regulator YiaG